jgi:hypothetical protein
MKRIYVAGALNSDAVGYIRNLNRMISYSNKLRRKGYSVFVPGLDFLMGLLDGDFDYKDYFENSQSWLAVSNIMFVCPGWESSKGTAKEIEYAKSLGIPIVYNDIDLLKDLK